MRLYNDMEHGHLLKWIHVGLCIYLHMYPMSATYVDYVSLNILLYDLHCFVIYNM